MTIFGTKTATNQILRVKVLPKLIFWNFCTPICSFLKVGKIKKFCFLLTFWPISRQARIFWKNALTATFPIGVHIFQRTTWASSHNTSFGIGRFEVICFASQGWIYYFKKKSWKKIWKKILILKNAIKYLNY